MQDMKTLQLQLRRHLFPQFITSWAHEVQQAASDKRGISSLESTKHGGCNSILFHSLCYDIKDLLTWEDFKLLPVLAEKGVCVVSASLNSSVI